ncbi:hypothetical protein FB565_006336 [Actinoplanes lutulentus]|uniref:Sugar phosphate isomerase/epimerase n=1 Tax=Actinoplanes lutulentus TaxID=1287878 RepID=A0A327Z6G9_9ACTN|nr:sugar phosphate isomerase/epimerase [Actinoplanes lutulentus]MBB2946568.1 hypothetical protein [Actinoplanes lutulentus]RAK26486.1 hypothetical protein B0I29_12776 [Actinoplanes lutulentus]
MSQDDNTSRLIFVQSLWAMEDLPWRGARSWTMEEQLAQLVAAGYSGYAVDLGASKAPTSTDLAAAAAGSGLSATVMAFVPDEKVLGDALRYAATIGARDLVLCAQHYTLDLGEAAALTARWHGIAAREGVRLELETHRNTMTNDLRFTAALAQRLPEDIDLAIDLSHYVVGAEIPSEPTAEIESQIAALLRRGGSVQGRVASRCQVQLPLHHESSRPWIALARRWWADAFEQILRRRPSGDVVFLTELGTAPYAITDAGGVQVSDRWAEAGQLREWATEAFTQALRSAPMERSA